MNYYKKMRTKSKINDDLDDHEELKYLIEKRLIVTSLKSTNYE
jgi:hypothetical protein